jgi:1,4-alpha-glucan branching enzyme
MMLQGQEMLADGAFHDDAPLDWSYAQSQAPVLEKYRELVRLRRNVQGHSAGLTGGDLTVTHMNQGAGVLAYRRSGAGLADVMVLVNTSSRAFTAYRIGVPHGGTWRVRVSTALDAPATLPALTAEPQAYDGLPYSVVVPLSVESGLVLSQD